MLSSYLQSHKLRNTPKEAIFEEIITFLSDSQLDQVFKDELKNWIVEQPTEWRKIIEENISNIHLETLGECIIKNTAFGSRPMNDTR